MTYPQIPIYAFNSPKNPSGVSPFQPTGKCQMNSLVGSAPGLNESNDCHFSQAVHSKQCQLAQRVQNRCRTLNTMQ